MAGKQNRITFAWWLEGWRFEDGVQDDLVNRGEKVVPNEYEQAMASGIFCPVCFTPLFRSPKEKPYFANKRIACFNHFASYGNIDCNLRTPKLEGMKFDSEETAAQAIAEGRLVAVHSFRNAPPILNAVDAGVALGVDAEDVDGPRSNFAISRHKGENFRLPTTVSSVGSICRRFDVNLHKYYLLPGRQVATMLTHALVDIATVEAPDEVPRLYFGEIINSFNAGRVPKPTNLRMTQLHCNARAKDFYLKAIDSEQTGKGINDGSIGRIILFWGKITESGIGLCVERLKWGEYAVLPAQYNRLLPKQA